MEYSHHIHTVPDLDATDLIEAAVRLFIVLCEYTMKYKYALSSTGQLL